MRWTDHARSASILIGERVPKSFRFFRKWYPTASSVSITARSSTRDVADCTEKASIDEAYMNLTPLVLERLIGAYPFLAEVPKDAPDGIDSPLPPAPPIDWTGAGHVLPIVHDDDEDAISENLEDEDGGEEREKARSTCWSDWALRIGADIMVDLRQEIWKRLHYTTSAGVAHNKAMAKVRT